MTVNIHPIERAVRGVVGVVLLGLIFVGPKTLWGLVGAVPLFTALSGWCPPYSLLGISTCREK
ncbi:MAG: YgaP family membrane protein [Acidobacteriota bacterium]